MDPRPFIRLAAPRTVHRPDLPPDLAHFYVENEGVGRESTPERMVRICQLREVARIGWQDLHILGSDECLGWETFAAFRIGISCFFDEIVYVLEAPCCDAGAIMALGVDIGGPGGTGLFPLEGSLVLAEDFTQWLSRLERCEWDDYGICPGALDELPPVEQEALRQYFKKLNPHITWGPAL